MGSDCSALGHVRAQLGLAARTARRAKTPWSRRARAILGYLEAAEKQGIAVPDVEIEAELVELEVAIP